jgi:hypothetical protein
LRVAHDGSTDAAEGPTDGGTFQTATALMANDATDRRAAECAQDRAGLRIRAAA